MPGLNETIQHATVVSGYDPNENRIITYVPEPDTVGSIPEKTFLELWEQDGFIAITIIPKDMKEINNNDSSDANSNLSYRMCLEAERLLISGNSNKAVEKIKKQLILTEIMN